MKHIDKLFNEKLYNHEVNVPDGMWEKIAPIAEEESGRAILWFWFAGVLTLLLGGYGIYKVVSTHDDNSDPSALVMESTSPSTTNEILVENISLSDESNLETQHLTESTSQAIAHQAIVEKSTSAPKAQSKTNQKPVANTISSTPTLTKVNSPSITNTIEQISNVGGVPANLVITKSYVNNKGSVIKQSNLTEDSSSDEPIYDVIINSEAKDLNAGALLRLIEPLENIPLPAFQKKLKKKNLEISIL